MGDNWVKKCCNALHSEKEQKLLANLEHPNFTLKYSYVVILQNWCVSNVNTFYRLHCRVLCPQIIFFLQWLHCIVDFTFSYVLLSVFFCLGKFLPHWTGNVYDLEDHSTQNDPPYVENNLNLGTMKHHKESHCIEKTGHLKSHPRADREENTFKCDLCQARFSQSGSLKRHLRTHGGEKPFKCDIHQSSFGQSGTLMTHLGIHSGEKPFKSDICQASFTESGTLKKHLRIHSGEKPFKCDICQASFSQSGTLKTHLRTHSGEKPFKCDLCQASFRHSASLKRHLRIHSGE